MPLTANTDKERSDDRVLVLEQIPGQATLSTKGLIDNRLFKNSGEHQLHARKHPQYDLWRLEYNHGVLPEELRQHFTSFSQLHKFAETYFKRRGIKVSKVVD